jgi:hypothetical protein
VRGLMIRQPNEDAMRIIIYALQDTESNMGRHQLINITSVLVLKAITANGIDDAIALLHPSHLVFEVRMSPED